LLSNIDYPMVRYAGAYRTPVKTVGHGRGKIMAVPAAHRWTAGRSARRRFLTVGGLGTAAALHAACKTSSNNITSKPATQAPSVQATQ
jgi:hypothetical protein